MVLNVKYREVQLIPVPFDKYGLVGRLVRVRAFFKHLPKIFRPF